MIIIVITFIIIVIIIIVIRACVRVSMLQVICELLNLLLVTQVEVALYSANSLLSNVSLIGEEPTLKEKVALMLQPAYILKGEPPPPPPPILSPYPVLSFPLSHPPPPPSK